MTNSLKNDILPLTRQDTSKIFSRGITGKIQGKNIFEYMTEVFMFLQFNGDIKEKI